MKIKIFNGKKVKISVISPLISPCLIKNNKGMKKKVANKDV